MIDTTELGAGSYPDAPEDNQKCYYFVIDTSNKVSGYIYADSIEEAEEMVKKGEYDEIEDNKIIQVEDIEKIEEER